jgi:serine phosphatase RsbU (regulator of sigma subunit)/tetratricopeptide (TPR) repeat protein
MKQSYHFTYLFFSLFIFPLASVSQSRHTDSLRKVLRTQKEDTGKVNSLYELGLDYYQSGTYKTADSIVDLQLALALKTNFKKGAALAYNLKGKLYQANNNNTEALKDFEQALKLCTDINDKGIEGTTYGDIGIIYENEGNYPEALKYQLSALKIREDMNDTLHIDIVCGNIGNIYNYQGNYPEALIYKQRSLALAKAIKDSLGMGYAYGDMGSIYNSLKKYDDALMNLQLALNLNKKLNDKQGIGNAELNIGNTYNILGNYDKALEYTYQGLEIYRAMGSQFLICYGYDNIAYNYIKKKDYAKALLYTDSLIHTGKNIEEKELLKDAYLYSAIIDSVNGDYKGAFASYKTFTQYRDSLKNEENTKKIVSEQMNYEFDKKQAVEKAEQDKKDAIAQDKSKRQKLVILFMALIALAVAAIAIVIFRSLRVTRKQKLLIEQQKEVVEEQKLLVEHQKAIVDEKNKDITDSIHYASRIQRALLTSDAYIGRYLKEHFILFKPRDIVSGDFYWAYQAPPEAGEGWGEAFYFACCDCTGHGVPGAFMSLLNISMLNESVLERKIIRPDMILNDVRANIIKALNPDGSDSGKDGMDCSLGMFDLKNNVLKVSCANNPVWIVKQDNSFVEVQPDKMPVGIQYGEQKPFKINTVQLSKGDCVYLFTDGYADQFGGPKGKKFKYKQLQELLIANAHKPMGEQKNILDAAIESWKGDLEQVDDILIIGIRI